jgi:type VI protein secretion system component Hcp
VSQRIIFHEFPARIQPSVSCSRQSFSLAHGRQDSSSPLLEELSLKGETVTGEIVLYAVGDGDEHHDQVQLEEERVQVQVHQKAKAQQQFRGTRGRKLSRSGGALPTGLLSAQLGFL